MVNLAPGLLCISDMDGNFKYINPAFEKVLGYSTLEIQNINFYDLIHLDDKSILDTFVDLRIDNNQIFNYEYRYRCKDGTYKWIEWSSKVQRDEKLIYSTGHDITARKKTEIELEKTKARLQEAQEFAHLGYWESNRKNGESFWSDELYRISGFEPEELKPTFDTFFNMIHPKDKAFVMNTLMGTSDNSELELDFRIIRQDGKIVWINEKVKYEFDQSGNPIHLCGIVQDITQRKLNENIVRGSEEKYKRLANNIPAGIVTYDTNGNITYVNPKLLEILGSPSEQITMSFNMFTFPLLIENGIAEAAKRCIENGEFVTVEKDYVSKWGKPSTLRIQASPISDNSGNIVDAIAIIEDFTERKMLEAELNRAKEQAEISNKAKSQFLANMSHEIRTPMNGLIGMIDLLKYTNLTNEQNEIVKVIKSSSESLLNIINDILDLSAIDAGKVKLSPETVDIDVLVKERNNLFSYISKNKGLDFEVHIENNVPRMIIVDKTRLVQVASNLIGNAIKFTQQGKIVVNIKKVKNIGNKVELIFSIADTGIGIKEEDIPSLFNYFTQLDETYTKRYQGAGLGLAISKGLVELMGGEIYVESEYGKGSIFYFTCIVDIPQGEESKACPQKTNELLRQANKLSILVIEDDYVSQLIIKQACKLKGWQTTITSSGKEALDMLENSSFDLILTDIQMAGMSGFDVSNAIREKEKITGLHIPIIATTAYAMSTDKQKCMDAGMDDYISKPIDINKLYETIEKLTKVL